MPLVVIRYSTRVPKRMAGDLSVKLLDVTAQALNIEGQESLEGKVAPSDIIVDCAPQSSIHLNGKDVEINIDAHDFPDRCLNLDERRLAIQTEVEKFLSGWGLSAYVWLRLMETSYGSSQPS